MTRFTRFAAVLSVAALSAGAALADYDMVRTELQTYLDQEGIDYNVEMATNEQLAAIQSVMDSEDQNDIKGEVTAILNLPDE